MGPVNKALSLDCERLMSDIIDNVRAFQKLQVEESDVRLFERMVDEVEETVDRGRRGTPPGAKRGPYERR